jgi:nucleotide-binding universal stress UspA family protein
MADDRELTFSSVVFGTDLSESAHVAGRYAALFARHYDAELTVVHAFTLVQPALEVEALEHVHSAQRRDLERLMSETVDGLARFAGRTASVLGEGSPIGLIRAVSERLAPSLIVLGTHGGGALERHIIGSVAEETLRTIPGPVLTIGPHAAMPLSAVLAFRHILYATDFSPAAAHAAPYALALARAFGSEIDVLHVVPGEAMGQPELLTEKEQEFLGALDRLVPEQARELRRSRSFVEFGQVRQRILDHASEGKVDLIVLGAHRHSWLARHVRTGPAFQIIVAAACPVLTVGLP